jgi:ATP-dependent Clp protease protease subunit
MGIKHLFDAPSSKGETKKDGSLASLDELGIIMINEGIDEDVSKTFIEKIITLNQSDKFNHITVILHSYGGYLSSGFSIVDFMDWSPLPVHVFAVGMAASAGIMITMAGEKGHRYCTPRTSFLSHHFWGLKLGSYPELVAERKYEDQLRNGIIRHYTEHTNLKTEKEVLKYLLRDTDTWLTPEEAKEYGIVDHITDDRKVIPTVIYEGFGDQ